MTSSLYSECNDVDLCNLDLRWSAVAVHQIVKATLGPRKRFVRWTFPGGRNAREQLLACLSSDDLHQKFVVCPVLQICPYQEIWGTYKKEKGTQKGKKEGRNYIITSWFLVSDSINFLVIKEQNLLVTFIQTSAELPCVGPKTLKVNVIDFHMFRYAIAFTQVRNCTYVCRMAKSICTNLWRLESRNKWFKFGIVNQYRILFPWREDFICPRKVILTVQSEFGGQDFSSFSLADIVF